MPGDRTLSKHETSYASRKRHVSRKQYRPLVVVTVKRTRHMVPILGREERLTRMQEEDGECHAVRRLERPACETPSARGGESAAHRRVAEVRSSANGTEAASVDYTIKSSARTVT